MDVRELKDKATQLFTKGKFAKAAETYEEYCAADKKDHQTRLRCGDAWAKAGKKDKAVIAYSLAAEGFAKDGFLPRAIAASKLVLEIDPAHKGVQKMLAELYAKKSGGGRNAAASKPSGIGPAPSAPEMEISRQVSAPVASSFAKRKDAIDLDAPIAAPQRTTGYQKKPVEAPSPMNRADALELPEYEIPMDDGTSLVGGMAAGKGPTPTKRADAIEIELETEKEKGPKALTNAAIELDVPTSPPASGEVEVAIEGQPIEGEPLSLNDQLPPELQVAAPLAPAPQAYELEIEVPAAPAPTFELEIIPETAATEPAPAVVYDLTDSIPEPKPSVPVLDLTEVVPDAPPPPPAPPPDDLALEVAQLNAEVDRLAGERAQAAKAASDKAAADRAAADKAAADKAAADKAAADRAAADKAAADKAAADKTAADKAAADKAAADKAAADKAAADKAAADKAAADKAAADKAAADKAAADKAAADKAAADKAREEAEQRATAAAERFAAEKAASDARAAALEGARRAAVEVVAPPATEGALPPGLKPKRAEAAPATIAPARSATPPAIAPLPVAPPQRARTAASTDLERSLEAFARFDPDAPVETAPTPVMPTPRAGSFTELDLDGDTLLHAVDVAAGTPPSSSVSGIVIEEAMEAPDDPKADPGALPKIPLFSDLPEDAFIALFERCPLQRFDEGQLVFEQGDKADAFFVICAGTARVFRTDGGVRKDLATLEEGSFFGEMALLSEAPRSASVEAATEDTQVLAISAEILTELSAAHPAVAVALKKFCRQRMLSNLMNHAAIFSPFNKSDRRELVQKFRARDVKKGDAIVKQGQTSDGLYVVLSGEVEVDAAGTTIATLREGEVFGEMSLLTRSPASATVRATRHTSLLRLPKTDFDQLILSHPQVLEHVSVLIDERKKADGRRASSEQMV